MLGNAYWGVYGRFCKTVPKTTTGCCKLPGLFSVFLVYVVSLWNPFSDVLIFFALFSLPPPPLSFLVRIFCPLQFSFHCLLDLAQFTFFLRYSCIVCFGFVIPVVLYLLAFSAGIFSGESFLGTTEGWFPVNNSHNLIYLVASIDVFKWCQIDFEGGLLTFLKDISSTLNPKYPILDSLQDSVWLTAAIDRLSLLMGYCYRTSSTDNSDISINDTLNITVDITGLKLVAGG